MAHSTRLLKQVWFHQDRHLSLRLQLLANIVTIVNHIRGCKRRLKLPRQSFNAILLVDERTSSFPRVENAK